MQHIISIICGFLSYTPFNEHEWTLIFVILPFSTKDQGQKAFSFKVGVGQVIKGMLYSYLLSQDM